MKTILLKLILCIFVSLFFNEIHNAYAQPFPVRTPTYEEFYNELSPHGRWINYLEYGDVWYPDLGEEEKEFQPYMTNGRWIYTDEGWYWYSKFSWGEIPFHYGSWIRDNSSTWLWIPGYDWAPAWVLWGETDDYICWTPLPPNKDATNFPPDSEYWNMVLKQYLTDIYVENYSVKNKEKGEIVPRIRLIYNSSDYAPRGPDANIISEYTRETITPISLKDLPPPVDGNERTPAN